MEEIRATENEGSVPGEHCRGNSVSTAQNVLAAESQRKNEEASNVPWKDGNIPVEKSM